jgi:Lon protease-like protein
MVNDSMKKHRIIGMIQPKKSGILKKPDLYEVGCLGKITSFNETEDGRILIILNGVCRFKIISEIKTNKLYRECDVEYTNYSSDISKKSNEVNFTDLSIIMENMKKFFKKQGYIVNLKDLEKRDLSQTLNDLSMASPFSLEEKQILLESLDINIRKEKLEQILNNYIKDEFENTTLQ